MANPLADALNALQTIPNAINTAQGTVQKVDRRVDQAVDIAETYASVSLFISALAAFSAFGIFIIHARNTGCGSGMFSNKPRTEIKSNPAKRRKKRRK
jgi:hypothetical protein